MRINCPNCDAQYEVPDEVIPPEGRDVQCSACETTWLQENPDHAGAARSTAPPDAPDPDTDTRTDKSAKDDGEAAGQPTPAELPRKELDPEVAAILREEAERERAARAADAGAAGLEVQPDLGLSEGAAATRRDARGPAEAAAEDMSAPVATSASGGAPDTARGARRDVLPDIEDISSTLPSDDDKSGIGSHRAADTSEETGARGGFRRGLLAALLIFVIGLLIYQFAPEIAEAVPQADPWLSAYVGWVDDVRTLLDQWIQAALTWLEDFTAPPGE